jgi:hypothetical protein
MADYFTKVSFTLDNITQEDATTLRSALVDLTPFLTEEEIEQLHLDPEHPALDYEFDGKAIWSENADHLEALAALIQRLCPSALPCSFQYSWDCTKPRTGAFGGGACVITANNIRFKTTNDIAAELLNPG